MTTPASDFPVLPLQNAAWTFPVITDVFHIYPHIRNLVLLYDCTVFNCVYFTVTCSLGIVTARAFVTVSV